MAHQQEDDAVRLDVAARLLQPVVDVLEGAAVGDVEEEQPAHRVAVVRPGDGSAAHREKPLSVCAFPAASRAQPGLEPQRLALRKSCAKQCRQGATKPPCVVWRQRAPRSGKDLTLSGCLATPGMRFGNV